MPRTIVATAASLAGWLLVASFAAQERRVAAVLDGKTASSHADSSLELPDAWPMYQANARHTGYLPISLDAASFALKWRRDVGGIFPLNPVTAAVGKVFVSLQTYFADVPTVFALDASDGETIWSKSYGPISSVNPPSYGYGLVYVQTGNHDHDTWLRAYVAGSGDEVFQAPHSAQWDHYFAPTIYRGSVYVNGGLYGGMYAFEASTGDRSWFLELAHYDEWTPAVKAELAYSYLGGGGRYEPGLHVVNRFTGAHAFFISDPNFERIGGSMDLAPVLGGHDDVIVIHDGRLISFDVVARSLRWELQREFQGQPSVGKGRIYAIDDGRLAVFDEVTGAELGTWQPPEGEGGLRGAMILTDSHLLASTAVKVYALDLATRQVAWSFPAAGHLALGNRTLYVASKDGTLTAISVEAGR